MLATIHSAALQGIDAEPVLVEVNTGEAGAPDLILVGLPDAAVKESEDRVSSALSSSGFHMPRSRTTINLARAISGRRARSTICPSRSGCCMPPVS